MVEGSGDFAGSVDGEGFHFIDHVSTEETGFAVGAELEEDASIFVDACEFFGGIGDEGGVEPLLGFGDEFTDVDLGALLFVGGFVEVFDAVSGGPLGALLEGVGDDLFDLFRDGDEGFWWFVVGSGVASSVVAAAAA